MADTKEKITEAAMTLFTKYGVRSITMEEIARQTAVSKKTLYQYFADKDDIVSKSTQRHLEIMKSEYEAIFGGNLSAIDELYEISKCFRKSLAETNPSLLFDLQKYHHDAWKVWKNYKTSYVKSIIARNLTKGVEEGVFRKELDVEILSTFRIEQVEMSFNDEVFPRDKFDVVEVQMMLFEHFIFGLLTDKGRKNYNKLFTANKPTQ